MRSTIETLKRFLSAEEVPRWFGFSVVLIFLLGIGAAMKLGVAPAREENAADFRRRAEYAVELLAERLENIDAAGETGLPGGLPDAADVKAIYRRELRTLATTFSMAALRIVDSRGAVVVSLGPTDRQAGLTGLESETPSGSFFDGSTKARVYRVPIRVAASSPKRPGSTSGLTASAAGAVLFLEALPASQPHAISSPTHQARMLAVVLVSLGLLFGLFRCLRRQLRGIQRIAEQLTAPRDRQAAGTPPGAPGLGFAGRLEDDLDSLRIADTVDSVTASWNDLIDLTQRLAQTVERSDADRELSAALQKAGGGALSEALDCIPDGILYITDSTRFEYVNASARRLLEWDTAKLGSRIDVAVTDARASGVGGQVLDLIRGALQSDGTYRTLTEVLSQEGSDDSSSYRVRVIALPHAQRFGECVVVIRDVSQQIRADRSREEFITQVTHELRTPLTNIRAYAETLSSGMFEDPAVVTECYNVITKETRRLSRLIEDILSVSQLDAGSIELQFDTVDLKALLDEAVRDVRGLADEKNIDLQLILPAKLEPIRADRDKLAVVLNNLLGNAIKYTLPDGNVVVGCQCSADETAITVKDNGVGIDPAEQGRVFEKFARSQDPAVQNEPGTGIGLYTAREIVRRHNGKIDLVSEKGVGSTFLVRLPRQATRATSLTTVEEA